MSGVGVGQIPDRLEPLSHRELLSSSLSGDTVGVPSSGCCTCSAWSFCLCTSISCAHVSVCVCVCTRACIHMHTPMSSPSICCQWSYCCASLAHQSWRTDPKSSPLFSGHLPVQAEAPVGRVLLRWRYSLCIPLPCSGGASLDPILAGHREQASTPWPLSSPDPPDITEVLLPSGPDTDPLSSDHSLCCQLF